MGSMRVRKLNSKLVSKMLVKFCRYFMLRANIDWSVSYRETDIYKRSPNSYLRVCVGFCVSFECDALESAQ